jgi:hypothetical protein
MVQWDKAGSGTCCGSAKTTSLGKPRDLGPADLRSLLCQFPTGPTFQKSRLCAYQASSANALLAVSFSHSRPSSAGVEGMIDEGALQLVTPPCNDGRPVLHVSDPRDFDADLTAPRLLSLPHRRDTPMGASTSRLLRRGQVPLISRTIALSAPPASTLFANDLCYVRPYFPRWVVL